MTSDELEDSLRQLVQEKKISVVTKEDGEDYFSITEKGINYLKNQVQKDFNFAYSAFVYLYNINRRTWGKSPEQSLISAAQIMCKLDPEFPDKLLLPREQK